MYFLSGLSNVEVKRFLRKKSEVHTTQSKVHNSEQTQQSIDCGSVSSADSSSNKSTVLHFGGIEFQREHTDKQLWKKTKFGWIPNASSVRAKFMNECLPKCYKAFYHTCKSPRDFAKQFHSEGRRQYDTHQRILKLSSRIDAILSNRDPGAAGKILNDDEYILIPSDQIILRNNIQKIAVLQAAIEGEDQAIKKNLDGLFTKSGKLKHGKECSNSFDVGILTRLEELKKKLESILKNLKEKDERCKDMFCGTLLKNKSKKRSRKQNENKSKKRKKQREEKNFQDIIQLISADTSASIIDEVNVEALSSLGAKKINWLSRMVNQGRVTEKAVVTIKDYVKGFMERADETTDEDDRDDEIVDQERSDDEIVDEDDSDDEVVDQERSDERIDKERGDEILDEESGGEIFDDEKGDEIFDQERSGEIVDKDDNDVTCNN